MVGGYLAEALGVPPDRDSIRAVPLDKFVRAASDLVVEVQTTPDPARWGRLTLSLLPFAPTVDGSVLPAAPLASFARGPGRERSAADRVEPGRGTAVPGRGGHHRPHRRADAGGRGRRYGLSVRRSPFTGQTGRAPAPGDLLAAVITDWFFRIPPIRVAEARAAAGAGDTWMYRFDHPDPQDNHRFGACHAAEIPFVFDTATRAELRPLIGDAPSSAVADRAHRVWVDFISARRPRLGALRRGAAHHRPAQRHRLRGRRPGGRRARALGRHPLGRLRESSARLGMVETVRFGADDFDEAVGTKGAKGAKGTEPRRAAAGLGGRVRLGAGI